MQTNSDKQDMSLHSYMIMTVSQNTLSKTCSMCQYRSTLMPQKQSLMLSVGNVRHTQQKMDLLPFSRLMQPPEQMLQ
jgi:hypothetical protein